MKATQALALIEAEGWEEARRKGSHRIFRRGNERRQFTYRDRVELGATQLRILAKRFGLRLKGVC